MSIPRAWFVTKARRNRKKISTTTNCVIFSADLKVNLIQIKKTKCLIWDSHVKFQFISDQLHCADVAGSNGQNLRRKKIKIIRDGLINYL